MVMVQKGLYSRRWVLVRSGNPRRAETRESPLLEASRITQEKSLFYRLTLATGELKLTELEVSLILAVLM